MLLSILIRLSLAQYFDPNVYDPQRYAPPDAFMQQQQQHQSYCNPADSSTFIPPQIADHILYNSSRYYFTCHPTPTGAQILAQSVAWSLQQYSSPKLISQYAKGPMCTKNTSLIYARSGLNPAYQSELVVIQLHALRKGEDFYQRFRYMRPTPTPQQWPAGIDSSDFVQQLATFYGGYIPTGTAIFGCEHSHCGGGGASAHAGIITHVTRSFNNENALVYWVSNNFWLRKEKDYIGRCTDWSYFGMGSLGNWMVEHKYYPSEEGKIATAKWSSIPLFEVVYEGGRPVKAWSVMPPEFDDLQPWTYFHVNMIVPVEVHREIMKNGNGTPFGVVEIGGI